MPASPPQPGLLESLRARSLSLRGAEIAARRDEEDATRDLDRRLLAAFRWLDEAVAHLDVIRPPVRHRFALDGTVAIASPRFASGFVSFRRGRHGALEPIERVDLAYRMAGAAPLRVEVPFGAAPAVEARLRAARLEFRYAAEGGGVRRGVFTVMPAVAASVRFVADYGRRSVVATLDNVDRLETVVLEFAPEALGEPALEDLVRLMLGESDAFLKLAPLAGVGRRPPGAAA